jgi:acetyl-CoA C-acetyltransferase
LRTLAFVQPGTAWKNIYEKAAKTGSFAMNRRGKQVYVNTDGGLKADGNPLGATGGAQVYEVYRQLRCEAG